MTLQAKIIAALIMAVLVTVFSVLGTQQVLTWKRGAEQGKAATETLGSASDIIGHGQQAQQNTAKREGAVTEARNDYNDARQEAENNEPSTRDWSAQPVPRSLRDAARARRIARERSGCVESECPRSDAAAQAQQRKDLLRGARRNE